MSVTSRALLRVQGQLPLLSLSPRRATGAAMEGGRQRDANPLYDGCSQVLLCHLKIKSALKIQPMFCLFGEVV